MLIPVVRRKVSYHTEWYNVVDFLKKQQFDIVLNREENTIDIRMPTRTDEYTHYVAHINVSDIIPTDLMWLSELLADNRELEFIEKYSNVIVWPERYQDVVICTSNLYRHNHD